MRDIYKPAVWHSLLFPPLTVSGYTSTVFKKSKTGSLVFKERQWWEACTGSATPLKKTPATKFSIQQTQEYFQKRSY